MSVLAVVPARRASTRLPAKMLADLAGAPLVVRTWQRVCLAGFSRVVVATDDDEIAAAVVGAGGEVVRTGEAPNGTVRVAEAVRRLGADADVVLNVQGDEPLVEPATLRRVAAGLAAGEFDVVTGAAPLPAAEAGAPSRVKVVRGEGGRALYFSREAVPHGGPFWVHVGVYAFRPAALQAVAALPETALERTERLEQLRWLAHGARIGVVEVDAPAPAVDTAADLDRVRALYNQADPGRAAPPGTR